MRKLNTNNEIRMMIQSPEYKKLKRIGKHKVFHQEGSAYLHSIMVAIEAEKKYGPCHWMVTVALLHDIGKIYTSVKNGEDDWSYPNHAKSGAEALDRFVKKDDPMYETYKWYIENHIFPLFWKNSNGNFKHTPPPNEQCTLENLRNLAIFDIKGSVCIPEKQKEQDELVEWLENCLRVN